MNKIKSGARKVGRVAKAVGKFTQEVGKRAISPSYTHKRIMGPNFGSKKR